MKVEEEVLFIGTAESEHTEMYLKAIWRISERGQYCRVNSIAKMLNIREPSVVQMLKKLRDKKLAIYNKEGVQLTEEGKRIGTAMMRNSRLLEVMMQNSLHLKIDTEMVCGMEHHMNKQFADALCTMLNHPQKCPHDNSIPRGECCE